jgi:malonyl-CoA O-methyltransferase
VASRNIASLASLGSLARWLRFGTPRRVEPREAYDLWAENYPPWPHNPLMEAEQSVVAPMIAGRAAGHTRRALDVGTGTGRCLPLLASTGARLVVGVDMSLAMLARRSFHAPRLCADACRLPFRNGAFDLVSSSLMVGDVDDLRAWISEAARVLAPGGSLIYSDFHPSWSDRGWKRTFRAADGQLMELGFHSHAIEEHLALLEAASLDVRAIREPRVPGGEAPVVAVFHAVKPSR